MEIFTKLGNGHPICLPSHVLRLLHVSAKSKVWANPWCVTDADSFQSWKLTRGLLKRMVCQHPESSFNSINLWSEVRPWLGNLLYVSLTVSRWALRSRFLGNKLRLGERCKALRDIFANCFFFACQPQRSLPWPGHFRGDKPKNPHSIIRC